MKTDRECRALLERVCIAIEDLIDDNDSIPYPDVYREIVTYLGKEMPPMRGHRSYYRSEIGEQTPIPVRPDNFYWNS